MILKYILGSIGDVEAYIGFYSTCLQVLASSHPIKSLKNVIKILYAYYIVRKI